MKKFSIPAFVENLTPDTANTKYSRAKLKIFYVGETVDHRLFTKEFSDTLLATAAYTPVVGFYSVADDDFVGHNNVQHIYGLIPADSTFEYVEDTEQNVTFAVTDIILYTGRPDEIGVVASKIVGKQHSLELNPDTIQYKINRDTSGNFKNIEFTSGELIGLSVLGDNDTPAFTGSEFFTTEELPDFITEENQGKYKALLNALFSVKPTAEEVVAEIYKALSAQNINGYLCEHIPDDYVVINSEYGVYSRYKCIRNEDNTLSLTYDCNVRSRFLSDEELEALANAQKGLGQVFQNDTTSQNNPVADPQTTADPSASASTNGEPVAEPAIENDIEAIRSNCSRLEGENNDLRTTIENLQNSLDSLQKTYDTATRIFKDGIMDGYKLVLSAETIEEFNSKIDAYNVDELIVALAASYSAAQAQTEKEIIEIAATDPTFNNQYNECDPDAVIQKYLKR